MAIKPGASPHILPCWWDSTHRGPILKVLADVTKLPEAKVAEELNVAADVDQVKAALEGYLYKQEKESKVQEVTFPPGIVLLNQSIPEEYRVYLSSRGWHPEDYDFLASQGVACGRYRIFLPSIVDDVMLGYTARSIWENCTVLEDKGNAFKKCHLTLPGGRQVVSWVKPYRYDAFGTERLYWSSSIPENVDTILFVEGGFDGLPVNYTTQVHNAWAVGLGGLVKLDEVTELRIQNLSRKYRCFWLLDKNTDSQARRYAVKYGFPALNVERLLDSTKAIKESPKDLGDLEKHDLGERLNAYLREHV
jgi:hypothetical protein